MVALKRTCNANCCNPKVSNGGLLPILHFADTEISMLSLGTEKVGEKRCLGLLQLVEASPNEMQHAQQPLTAQCGLLL